MNELKTQLTRCLPLFTALGDPHRQAILLLFAQHGRLNVGQIVELMPLSRPAISHHLKLMRDADIVAVEQVGNERFYSMKSDDYGGDTCPIHRLHSLVSLLQTHFPNPNSTLTEQ